MLFWISWYQPTEDHRPLAFPPNKGVLGWWCTGERMDGAGTLCALVTAENQTHAEEVVRVDWPEAEEWRFCDNVENTKLGDRFPLADWSKSRIDEYNESK